MLMTRRPARQIAIEAGGPYGTKGARRILRCSAPCLERGPDNLTS